MRMTETEDQASLKAAAEIFRLWMLGYGEEISNEEAEQRITNHLRQEAERKTYKNRWQLRIKELIVNRGENKDGYVR